MEEDLIKNVAITSQPVHILRSSIPDCYRRRVTPARFYISRDQVRLKQGELKDWNQLPRCHFRCAAESQGEGPKGWLRLGVKGQIYRLSRYGNSRWKRPYEKVLMYKIPYWAVRKIYTLTHVSENKGDGPIRWEHRSRWPWQHKDSH